MYLAALLYMIKFFIPMIVRYYETGDPFFEGDIMSIVFTVCEAIVYMFC